MLSSIESYSRAIYTLLGTTPTIRNHSIRIYPRGAQVGVVEGNIEFDRGIVLRVYERLDFARRQIVAYSYEVWRGQQQLYWYDPTPHPADPSLASTHPHHKHVPPEIKHHRIPASGICFDRPNLPILIAEIERDWLAS